MLDLFKGQFSWTDLTVNMSYKEALMLRDIRIARKNKEGNALEDALSDIQK